MEVDISHRARLRIEKEDMITGLDMDMDMDTDTDTDIDMDMAVDIDIDTGAVDEGNVSLALRLYHLQKICCMY
jgi:hypothetical protein